MMNDFICQNPTFQPKTFKNLVYSNYDSALNIDTQKTDIPSANIYMK